MRLLLTFKVENNTNVIVTGPDKELVGNEAAKIRAITNFALLQNEYRDVELILEDENYDILGLEVLEVPERKTQASVFTLQAFEIANEERDEFITGNRWIQLNLPQ